MQQGWLWLGLSHASLMILLLVYCCSRMLTTAVVLLQSSNQAAEAIAKNLRQLHRLQTGSYTMSNK